MHRACWRTLVFACLTYLSLAHSTVASASPSAENAAAFQISVQLDRHIWRDALEPGEAEHIPMLFDQTDPLLYQKDPLRFIDRRGKPYSPPRGAMGQLWGTPREKFTELESPPFAIQIAPFNGHTWLLAEYYTPGFDLSTADGTVRVPPASLMFCAQQYSQWPISIPFRSMSLCGLRLRINRDRVQPVLAPTPTSLQFSSALEYLRMAFGEPDNFPPEAAVGVKRVASLPAPGSDEWHWCKAAGSRSETKCRVSMMLKVDPEDRTGILLLATPVLYQHAVVLQKLQAKDDSLNPLLHGTNFKSLCWHSEKCTYWFHLSKYDVRYSSGIKQGEGILLVGLAPLLTELCENHPSDCLEHWVDEQGR